MTMTRTLTAAMLGGGLLLSGCGDAGDEGGTLRGALVQKLAAVGGQAPEGGRITASDEELREYDQDLILVRIPSRNSSAGLTRRVRIGGATTWITGDGVAVTLRQGQLISTSGLGNDLTSADVPNVWGIRGRAVRDLYHLGGNERIQRTRWFCEITDRGVRPVEVTGVQYAALLVIETCTDGEGGEIENRFWIQPEDSLIRKSRQWAGPEIGYLIIENVHG